MSGKLSILILMDLFQANHWGWSHLITTHKNGPFVVAIVVVSLALFACYVTECTC